MSKYPLLNIYRVIAIIFAVLLILVGIIAAIKAGSGDPYDQTPFDLGVFIGTLIPFLGYAFGLGVVAELILLFLQMADNLEQLLSASERQVVREAAASRAAASAAKPTSSAAAPEPTARVKAKLSTAIRTQPTLEASSSSELSSGQTMPIYGRTSDNAWFTISRQGKLWLDAADVEVIEGYVSNLPVIEPA